MFREKKNSRGFREPSSNRGFCLFRTCPKTSDVGTPTKVFQQ
ncbi:hypothetical protein LBBP_03392 [Leptospira borgpetersenii serovar Ballum]|uniref:Uncharacterized protein n=1 Tax=Leptospira borgpetersenii serovar Ballum TaxID=280505 RepID=A0A0S2IVB3_LEPBO|nr:hypothetical protein LBBP_03392 [Leptospira borgpetersenii serovar Ballum]